MTRPLRDDQTPWKKFNLITVTNDEASRLLDPHTHTLLDYAERLIYSDEPDPILILISRAEIAASGVYKTEKLFT